MFHFVHQTQHFVVKGDEVDSNVGNDVGCSHVASRVSTIPHNNESLSNVEHSK